MNILTLSSAVPASDNETIWLSYTCDFLLGRYGTWVTGFGGQQQYHDHARFHELSLDNNIHIYFVQYKSIHLLGFCDLALVDTITLTHIPTEGYVVSVVMAKQCGYRLVSFLMCTGHNLIR